MTPAQLASCDGIPDTTPCDIAGDPGVCRDGVCLPAGCGDGVVAGSEECDGMVADDQDDCTEHDYQNAGEVTCNADCTFNVMACAGRCGDGIVNGDEVCDYVGQQLDGNTCLDLGYYVAEGLACSKACTFDVSQCDQRCGDGARNGSEACDGVDLGERTCIDLGFYNVGALACSQACSFDTTGCTGYCGDRVTTAGREFCDGKLGLGQSCVAFGFTQGAMGCSAQCAPDITACSAPEQQPWPYVPVQAGQAPVLQDAWSASPSDVFVVGCIGSMPCTSYVARGSGSNWTPLTGATGFGELRGVWGASSSDVFAVGAGGTIVHFDGSQWMQQTSNTTKDLDDVWGTSGSDVYAVGAEGTVLHYNGSQWAAMAPAVPSAVGMAGIWGTSATNMYLVGDSGQIWHFSSGTWAQETSSTTSHLRDVWGASSDEIYAVGWDGTIVRKDAGTQWESMTSGSSQNFTSVSGSGSGDVYAVGTNGDDPIRHFDGVTWRAMKAPGAQGLYGVHAAGERDIYAVSSAGNIARFTGGGWARWSYAGTNSIVDFHLTGDTLLGVDPNFYTEIPGGTTTTSGALVTTIDGNGADIFAMGLGGVIRKRTAALTWTPVTSPVSSQMNDITWPFAVGSSTILKYDTGTWTPMTAPTGPIRRVWAASDTDAFAVGGLGKVHRLSGGSWTTMVFPVSRLVWGVWGSAIDDVFVSADEGEIYHWNGTIWTKQATPTNDAIFEIDGTGPADILAITETQVLHYDGLSWSLVAIPTGESMTRIHGDIISGHSGLVLERRRHCVAAETSCADDRDEDCDGYYDCGDVDCSADASCSTGGLCSGAATLACNSTVSGDTSTGTAALSRYACDAWTEHGRELVYTITPTTSGTVTLTLDATADLDIIVLARGAGGGCEPRNPGCMASSSVAGGDETVSFTAAANETYYVVIDGYGSSAGTFSLNASCP